MAFFFFFFFFGLPCGLGVGDADDSDRLLWERTFADHLCIGFVMGAEEEDALSESGGCVACSNWLDDEAIISSGKVEVKVGIGFLLLPLAFEMARQ